MGYSVRVYGGKAMDGIIVRDMRPADSEQVRALFESVYKSLFSGAVPAFESAVRGERIFVALHSGLIAGIATVWEADSFIHFLFFDRRFRRKGVGRAMITKIAETYERPLTLKCLLENAGAMAFYRATGWREMETGLCEEGAYALLRYDLM